MRGVDERVVVGRPFAASDGFGFALDSDHRLNETVELCDVFALGRFDHEGSRNGERHRRGVEAVIDKALRDVVDRDTRFGCQWPEVEDALVCDQTVFSRVQNRVVLAKSRCYIVCGEYCGCCRVTQTVRPQHANVSPRNREDAGATERRCGNRTSPVNKLAGLSRCRVKRGVVRRLRHGVAGQERSQVCFRTNRSDAGASAAVRDREGFVQVEVGNVPPDVAVASKPEQRVEVGAVNVDLTTGVVNGSCDRLDPVLVHSVSRRIRDHQRGKSVAMRLNFCVEVGNVNIAVLFAGNDDDGHAGEDCGRRVCSVGTRRDDARHTVVVASREVVAADSQKSGEFSLRTRVWLKADGVVAGQFDQPLFELRDEQQVTAHITGRCIRVDSAELTPGDSFHLRCRVELHCARTKRNHSAVECVILIGESLEESHHRGFAAIRVEHLVGENVVRPNEGRGNCRVDQGWNPRGRLGSETENRIEQNVVSARKNPGCVSDRQLVERELNGVGIDEVQQQPTRVSRGNERCRLAGNTNLNRVEERIVNDRVPRGHSATGETSRTLGDTNRDFAQTLWSVVHGIHAGENCEQNLRSTNVGRCLLATDVLLTSLKSQAVRGLAVGIARNTDQSARHLSFEAGLDREERGVRPTESERNAESLR